MKTEGAGATGRRAGMELRHGLTVLGDHQHLAGGGHLIHQPKAASLELRGADRGHHVPRADSKTILRRLKTMVMTMLGVVEVYGRKV
jgi:hypothetical protein